MPPKGSSEPNETSSRAVTNRARKSNIGETLDAAKERSTSNEIGSPSEQKIDHEIEKSTDILQIGMQVKSASERYVQSMLSYGWRPTVQNCKRYRFRSPDNNTAVSPSHRI